MDDSTSDGATVWKVAALALALIATGAGVFTYAMYGALTTQLAAARSEAAAARAEGASLRAQLTALEAQAESEQLQREGAQARAAASRPDLPVELTFHDAVLRSGKIAVLQNLSDSDLEVELEVHSPATGEHLDRQLVIGAHGMLQIGAAQGWRFAPGQIVTLDSNRYRPMVRIVG